MSCRGPLAVHRRTRGRGLTPPAAERAKRMDRAIYKGLAYLVVVLSLVALVGVQKNDWVRTKLADHSVGDWSLVVLVRILPFVSFVVAILGLNSTVVMRICSVLFSATVGFCFYRMLFHVKWQIGWQPSGLEALEEGSFVFIIGEMGPIYGLNMFLCAVAAAVCETHLYKLRTDESIAADWYRFTHFTGAHCDGNRDGCVAGRMVAEPSIGPNERNSLPPPYESIVPKQENTQTAVQHPAVS